MTSHITVHMLVSLEKASHKFGTKCELHIYIYFKCTYVFTLIIRVNHSYVVHTGKAECVRAQCVLPSRWGQRFKRYRKNRACSASNPKIELSCLSTWVQTTDM